MKQTSEGLFQNPALRSFLVKTRKPLFILVLVLVAPFARPEWLLAGFVVSMVGEFIQLWCFASLDKNSTLTIRGPYTMVRNPMYLGRFFIPFGFLMLLGQWWLLLIYTVVYWKYMDARRTCSRSSARPTTSTAPRCGASCPAGRWPASRWSTGTGRCSRRTTPAATWWAR